ncbi:MAG: hypothetical protein ACWGO1_02085 [Anaerolineales bacterium]
MNKSTPFTIYLLLALTAVLVGCSNQGSAADSILNYLQALTSGNRNQLVLASCADWEAQAVTELESFSAVTVSLEDASCSESGKDGDITLVSCSGKIVANYGNEVLEIDLSERTYQAVTEGGEWRMCGYR